MNTIATYLPSKIAKADSLGLWAFSAAVRLSDQNKPIGLKLLVELAIIIRMLAALAKNVRCGTGKTIVAHRAKRPITGVSARRGRSAKRIASVKVSQHGVVVARRAVRSNVSTSTGSISRPNEITSLRRSTGQSRRSTAPPVSGRNRQF